MKDMLLIFLGVIGSIIGQYIYSYFSEKGKNKAAISDRAELIDIEENQKERYNKEIERFKSSITKVLNFEDLLNKEKNDLLFKHFHNGKDYLAMVSIFKLEISYLNHSHNHINLNEKIKSIFLQLNHFTVTHEKLKMHFSVTHPIFLASEKLMSSFLDNNDVLYDTISKLNGLNPEAFTQQASKEIYELNINLMAYNKAIDAGFEDYTRVIHDYFKQNKTLGEQVTI